MNAQARRKPEEKDNQMDEDEFDASDHWK